MKKTHLTTKVFTATSTDPRAGFSMVDLMMSLVITTGALAAALMGFTETMRHAQQGTQQVNMIENARSAEQRLVKIIQSARAVSADSDTLRLMMPDFSQQTIKFIDADSDPETVEDNTLEYDPDPSTPGDEVTLVASVSPLGAEAMFEVIAANPSVTAKVHFHVGEIPVTGEQLGFLEGYQGVEIRTAATPRNRGTTYGQSGSPPAYAP